MAKAGDLGPEGICTIPAEDSPTGNAMILVANEISGTVTVTQIVKTGDSDDTSSDDADSGDSGSTDSGTTGSSSSGGSFSGSSTSSTTIKNADGSTTTTTTNKKTGTVTETTKTADGVTGTTVTNKDGKVTEVTAAIPSAAAKEAQENGEAVTLPVEVEAAADSDDAVEIEINLPKSAGDTKVEIPVENVTSSAVAVIVHADGTEEIVKTSVVTEDGVALTVAGDVTVKIVDNSTYFVDVHPVNHWAKDNIDFVTSRQLFNGTTATTFSPNNNTTRGQVMTVLARLDGADTSGSPIQKGMAWAVETGISDGTNPNGSITRQQLAAMLWRYAGCPDSDYSIERYTDDQIISDYAETAMRWAIERGILTGYADGSLKPHATATRAHVATMVARFVNYIA